MKWTLQVWVLSSIFICFQSKYYLYILLHGHYYFYIPNDSSRVEVVALLTASAAPALLCFLDFPMVATSILLQSCCVPPPFDMIMSSNNVTVRSQGGGYDSASACGLRTVRDKGTHCFCCGLGFRASISVLAAS